MHALLLSRVWLFVTPRTAAHQAPPPMGFSRQESWSGLPLPSPFLPIFQAFCCCCAVTQSCPTLCDPMDCSTLGFPVLHHLLELAQTHFHWLGDAIQLIISKCPIFSKIILYHLILCPNLSPSLFSLSHTQTHSPILRNSLFCRNITGFCLSHSTSKW